VALGNRKGRDVGNQVHRIGDTNRREGYTDGQRGVRGSGLWSFLYLHGMSAIGKSAYAARVGQATGKTLPVQCTDLCMEGRKKHNAAAARMLVSSEDTFLTYGLDQACPSFPSGSQTATGSATAFLPAATNLVAADGCSHEYCFCLIVQKEHRETNGRAHRGHHLDSDTPTQR
jgi:hypothetical protein